MESTALNSLHVSLKLLIMYIQNGYTFVNIHGKNVKFECAQEIIRIISTRKANKTEKNFMKNIEEREKFDIYELKASYDFKDGMRGDL